MAIHNSQFVGGHEFQLGPFEFFRAFAQRHPAKAGLATIFSRRIGRASVH
jgi:hypothetical protein